MQNRFKNTQSILLLLLILPIIISVFFVSASLCSCHYTNNNDPPIDETPTDGNTVNFSELTYVALGDSITHAMDGIRGGALMDEPYCEIVKNSLGLKSVINYGISGSTVCTSAKTEPAYEPMCERYAGMSDADIVSVMGGTNDCGRNADLGNIEDNQSDTFYGALNILCAGLKEKYSNSFIFFMTPLKVKTYKPWDTFNDEVFDLYRQAIKDVCAKFDIPVLDTANLADTSQEFNDPQYSGDGLHPSQEFHRNVLAPVIVKYIEENYTPQV